MSAERKNEPLDGESLSALIDGELDAGLATAACAAWRESGSTRSTWHAYHLIGDVLRSEDLASTPQRDAAFLARLKVRLADEPVVLAPQPLERAAQTEALPRVAVAGRARRRSWRGAGRRRCRIRGRRRGAGRDACAGAGRCRDGGGFEYRACDASGREPGAAHDDGGGELGSRGHPGAQRPDPARCASRSLPRGAQAVLRQLRARCSVRVPAQRDGRRLQPLIRA